MQFLLSLGRSQMSAQTPSTFDTIINSSPERERRANEVDLRSFHDILHAIGFGKYYEHVVPCDDDAESSRQRRHAGLQEAVKDTVQDYHLLVDPDENTMNDITNLLFNSPPAAANQRSPDRLSSRSQRRPPTPPPPPHAPPPVPTDSPPSLFFHEKLYLPPALHGPVKKST